MFESMNASQNKNRIEHQLNKTHNPNAKSWVAVPEECHFPIQNLPYGIFSSQQKSPRVGVAIGDFVLDLLLLEELKLIPSVQAFDQSNLNALFAQGRSYQSLLRSCLFDLLHEDCSTLLNHPKLDQALIPIQEVQMHLPATIGAFVDFYSNENHASNVGKMFRDPTHPLLANWKHVPIAYNGRASSIVNSGTPIHRPSGQIKPIGHDNPIFCPTQELDFELELGFFTCQSNSLGHSIPIHQCLNSIYGLVLVNDWSARDIQRWEYQPLGPFLAKSFATSISPWVVTLEALEPWRLPNQIQDPTPLPYLQEPGSSRFNIQLDVSIQTQRSKQPIRITQTNANTLYWSFAQQLAHQTVNGTNVQIGDLYASGTISGSEPGTFGSLLETCWNKTKPLTLSETHETRTYLEDYDKVRFSGYCQGEKYRVGFGTLESEILPALQ
jgi:fumarylacetoacetase